MNKLLTTLFALAVSSTALTALAQEVKGDAQAGQAKNAMCIGCHGIVGYQSSFPEVYKVPMISGQSAAYLSAALQAYKKGERRHPTMRGGLPRISRRRFTHEQQRLREPWLDRGVEKIDAATQVRLCRANDEIPRVVIACLDHSPKVSGRGVELLRAAGVEVTIGILENEGNLLSAPSNVYQQFQRPYVILKWAQTNNGMFAPADRSQTWISNAYTRRLTHKWRMEADGILVGTTTALHDNPSLNNRFYFGKSPRPIVLDRLGILPGSLHLFQQVPAIRITHPGTPTANLSEVIETIEVDFEAPDFALQLLQACAHAQIGILLVEGGAQLLHTFIQAGTWDEARVIQNTSAWIQNGISAPTLPVPPKHRVTYYDDQVSYFFSDK